MTANQPESKPATDSGQHEGKHTPGPWSVAEHRDGKFGHQIGCTVVCQYPTDGPVVPAVCMLPPGCHGENGANARLIAAAPDLLSVVADLVAGDDRNEIQYANGRVSHMRYMNLLAAARAALGKATT